MHNNVAVSGNINSAIYATIITYVSVGKCCLSWESPFLFVSTNRFNSLCLLLFNTHYDGYGEYVGYISILTKSSIVAC